MADTITMHMRRETGRIECIPCSSYAGTGDNNSKKGHGIAEFTEGHRYEVSATESLHGLVYAQLIESSTTHNREIFTTV